MSNFNLDFVYSSENYEKLFSEIGEGYKKVFLEFAKTYGCTFEDNHINNSIYKTTSIDYACIPYQIYATVEALLRLSNNDSKTINCIFFTAPSIHHPMDNNDKIKTIEEVSLLGIDIGFIMHSIHDTELNIFIKYLRNGKIECGTLKMFEFNICFIDVEDLHSYHSWPRISKCYFKLTPKPSNDDNMSINIRDKVSNIENIIKKYCNQYGGLSCNFNKNNELKLQYLNPYVENLFISILNILSYNNGRIKVTSYNIDFTEVFASKIHLVRNNIYSHTNDMIIDYRISILLEYTTSKGECKLFEVSSITDEKALVIYDNIVLCNDNLCEQNREDLATNGIVSVTIR